MIHTLKDVIFHLDSLSTYLLSALQHVTHSFINLNKLLYVHDNTKLPLNNTVNNNMVENEQALI